jgi:hypothetical protein
MLAANCGRDQRGAVIVEVTIVMTCPTRVAGVDVSSGGRFWAWANLPKVGKTVFRLAA